MVLYTGVLNVAKNEVTTGSKKNAKVLIVFDLLRCFSRAQKESADPDEEGSWTLELRFLQVPARVQTLR